ncbi:MAG: phytanoyl-CoA dioxygenase family protein [Gammaproteobacteria bacterium]|nr:phytanoyl-CoA dioxygenase family protein [Gammaproteobacteria bacterium]
MSTSSISRPGIKRFFDRNGYYLAQGVYSEESLQSMESEFDRIVDQISSSGEQINARWHGPNTDQIDGGVSRIIHTHNVHRYSAVWLQALLQKRFLEVVTQILGPDTVLHHTKLFQKPPREGAPFPIHQDWTYFPTKHDTMIAGIIFLTDATDETGGLRLYPGTHKLGRQVNSSGRVASNVLDRYPLDQAQAISAERGDVLFFSYFTLHGSTPNQSDRVRKTVLAELHSGKDFVTPRENGSHVNEHLVLSGWNYHMTRQLADV